MSLSPEFSQPIEQLPQIKPPFLRGVLHRTVEKLGAFLTTSRTDFEWDGIDQDRSKAVDILLAQSLTDVGFPGNLAYLRQVKGHGWFHVPKHGEVEKRFIEILEERLAPSVRIYHPKTGEATLFIFAALGIDPRVYGTEEFPAMYALTAHTPLSLYSEGRRSQRDPDVNMVDETITVAQGLLEEGLIKRVPINNRYSTHYIYLSDKVDSLLI